MSGSGARDGLGSSPWDPPNRLPPELGQGENPAQGEDPGHGDTGQGDTAQDDPARRGPRKKRRGLWVEFAVFGVILFVIALVIKAFVIQAFYIPSGSMQNTLAIGDRVVVNKLVYHFRGIARGDIVVFNGEGSWDFDDQPASSSLVGKVVGDAEGLVGISHSDDIYIKRVIGLPGDHVVCCNAKGQITVNGVALTETSYLYPGNAPSTQPFNITVPPGRLWVMGDHRFISYDSRGHMGDPGGGTIPENQVLGRAFVIIWPPSQVGFLNIPATFEQPKLNASAAAAGGNSKALAAAMDTGAPIQQAGSALPLALGFAGAVPLTVVQAVTRRRLAARRSRRRARQD